jgi:hypothetical protein
MHGTCGYWLLGVSISWYIELVAATFNSDFVNNEGEYRLVTETNKLIRKAPRMTWRSVFVVGVMKLRWPRQ